MDVTDEIICVAVARGIEFDHSRPRNEVIAFYLEELKRVGAITPEEGQALLCRYRAESSIPQAASPRCQLPANADKIENDDR